MKKKHGTEVKRTEREDVIQIIKGCGGRDSNPLPGYESKINIKNYKNGKHTLKVKLIAEDGNDIRELTQSIIIDNSIKGRMCIDTPQPNETVEGTQITVSGWAMSTDSKATLKVYIDGKETRNRSKKNKKRRYNTNNKRLWRKR